MEEGNFLFFSFNRFSSIWLARKKTFGQVWLMHDTYSVYSKRYSIAIRDLHQCRKMLEFSWTVIHYMLQLYID